MGNLINNKKVKFHYEILDTFEAGIVLSGIEVKSLKAGQGSLIGAYIIIRGNEAFLVEAEIPPYQKTNTPDSYEPRHPRKLLLNKKELLKLAEFDNQKGLTLVPLSLYNKNRNIKLEFAVARGKKMQDKRQSIQKREADREISRTLKKLR
jgi:SsrA-binding protein